MRRLVAMEIEAFAIGTTIVDLATDPADGTAWVTSGSRIRHFGRDGALLHDLLPTLPGGSAHQFRFLELFSDRTPPDVRIVSPAAGATVRTSRPTLRLEYHDPAGRGVATETLELIVEGSVLPADCDIGPLQAQCVPTIDLPEGEITILPRILDLAGSESADRPHTITIGSDTPPQITLFYPEDGLQTRWPSESMEGQIDRPAELTINGVPVEVGPDLWFWHEVDLVEGENVLTFVAVDAAGLSSQLQIRIVRDSVPPAVPNLSLISVTIDEATGRLRLSAPPGTFEPFALIRVYNRNSGVETVAVANADGSLSAVVSARPRHELSITVSDAAGNELEEVEFPFTIDQLTLTVELPDSPVTVESRDLIISGWFTGPADTTITAGGVLAAISGSGMIRDFIVRVPLAAGENVIQVVAAALGRAPVMREVRAMRDGDEPFRVEASATDGLAPLEVEFTVQRFSTTQIWRIRVNFDDGSDAVIEGSRVPSFRHKYTEPGSYNATFTIQTYDNTQYFHRIPITVYAAEDRDNRVQATWQRFRNALTAGDTSTALTCMTTSAAERYASALTSLQSSLPQIVTTFSDLSPTGSGSGEYVVLRDIDGQLTAFLIYFMRGSDGRWRIAGL